MVTLKKYLNRFYKLFQLCNLENKFYDAFTLGSYGPTDGLLQTSEKRLLQFYFLFGMCTSPFCAMGYVLQRYIHAILPQSVTFCCQSALLDLIPFGVIGPQWLFVFTA